MKFKIKAVDKKGKTVQLETEAENKKAAICKLLIDGYTVLDAVEVDNEPTKPQAKAALVECKSCKYSVDPRAKTCPSCGVNLPGISEGKGCLLFLIWSALAYAFIDLWYRLS